MPIRTSFGAAITVLTTFSQLNRSVQGHIGIHFVNLELLGQATQLERASRTRLKLI
jgi:hypothetical protein